MTLDLLFEVQKAAVKATLCKSRYMRMAQQELRSAKYCQSMLNMLVARPLVLPRFPVPLLVTLTGTLGRSSSNSSLRRRTASQNFRLEDTQGSYRQ